MPDSRLIKAWSWHPCASLHWPVVWSFGHWPVASCFALACLWHLLALAFLRRLFHWLSSIPFCALGAASDRRMCLIPDWLKLGHSIPVLPCIDLSLALLKGFSTEETFYAVQNSSSIMILQKRNRTARVPYFETKKRPWKLAFLPKECNWGDSHVFFVSVSGVTYWRAASGLLSKVQT